MASIEQIRAMFGCSYAQLAAQYTANKAQTAEMHAQAVATGKKVRGYTAEKLAASLVLLTERIARCNELAATEQVAA